MRKFRKVLAEARKEETHRIDRNGVVHMLEPITSWGEYDRLDKSPHPKKSKKKLREDKSYLESHYTDADENDSTLPWLAGTKGLDADFNEQANISDKLHERLGDLSEEQEKHLRNYSKGSRQYNKALIQAHNEGTELGANLPDEHKKSLQRLHEGMMSTQHPAGQNIHLYSGTTHDFAKMVKDSPDGLVHSPAHISASHDIHVGAHFSNQAAQYAQGGKTKFRDAHMIHVHMKPHQKMIHMSGHSDYPAEHESVIPAGTVLKYSHTTTHYQRTKPGEIGNNEKNKVHIHHFTIHDNWNKSHPDNNKNE